MAKLKGFDYKKAEADLDGVGARHPDESYSYHSERAVRGYMKEHGLKEPRQILHAGREERLIRLKGRQQRLLSHDRVRCSTGFAGHLRRASNAARLPRRCSGSSARRTAGD